MADLTPHFQVGLDVSNRSCLIVGGNGEAADKAERLSLMLSDPTLATMALPDDELAGEIIDPDDLDALFGHLER